MPLPDLDVDAQFAAAPNAGLVILLFLRFSSTLGVGRSGFSIEYTVALADNVWRGPYGEKPSGPPAPLRAQAEACCSVLLRLARARLHAASQWSTILHRLRNGGVVPAIPELHLVENLIKPSGKEFGLSYLLQLPYDREEAEDLLGRLEESTELLS